MSSIADTGVSAVGTKRRDCSHEIVLVRESISSDFPELASARCADVIVARPRTSANA